jgi:hypothetical protein
MAANKKSPPHFILLAIFAFFFCIFFLLHGYPQYNNWLGLSLIMLWLAYKGYIRAIKIILVIVFFSLLIPASIAVTGIVYLLDFEDLSSEFLQNLTRLAVELCTLGLLLIYVMFESEKSVKVSSVDDRKQSCVGPDSTDMKIDLPSDNPLFPSNLPLNNDLNLSKFDEERSYEQAENEVLSGIIRKGLWAKCWAENDGDEIKTKAHYIKTRAKEILHDAKIAEG